MGIDPKTLGLDARRQIIEKLGEQVHTGTARKYHNQPTTRKGIRFDSKKEAQRYDYLILLLEAGAISELKLQPQFTLVEAYTTPEGKRVRAMRYVADFSYWKGGKLTVEDVKSSATKTREYQMKKKLLLDRFGIEITEV